MNEDLEQAIACLADAVRILYYRLYGTEFAPEVSIKDGAQKIDDAVQHLNDWAGIARLKDVKEICGKGDRE